MALTLHSAHHLDLEMKLYWNIATLIHLCAVLGCLPAEVSSCDRNYLACKAKILTIRPFPETCVEPTLDREDKAIKKNNQIPVCLQMLLFLRQQCMNAYCLRGSPSLTHGVTVDATARGLQGRRKKTTGEETDVQEQVRERKGWESGLVSVETSWNSQATGMPPAGPPTHRRAGNPMYQNHLET